MAMPPSGALRASVKVRLARRVCFIGRNRDTVGVGEDKWLFVLDVIS